MSRRVSRHSESSPKSYKDVMKMFSKKLEQLSLWTEKESQARRENHIKEKN